MGVAPTRSPAARALSSTSAWLGKPFSAVRPFCRAPGPATGCRRRRSGRRRGCPRPAGRGRPWGWRRRSGRWARTCRCTRPCVVAVVVGHAPVLAEGQGGALAAEAADGGALLRRASGVGRSTTQPKRCGSCTWPSWGWSRRAWRRSGVGGLPAVVLAQPFLAMPAGHALGMVGRVAVDEGCASSLAGEVGAPGVTPMEQLLRVPITRPRGRRRSSSAGGRPAGR